jgi:hypothetical protein
MKQLNAAYVLRHLVFISGVLLLTLLTQIGGVILVLAVMTFPLLGKRFVKIHFKNIWVSGYFIILYLLTTLLIIPLLAPLNGRVALPYFNTSLHPHSWTTVLLNRHYVRPQLKSAITDISIIMNKKCPGTEVLYLDANFPFINKFPLLPHLSHNDGRKLDLAFCYLDKKTGREVNDSPSWLGYGVCEEPENGEYNAALFCDSKGYWQYSFLKKFIPGESSYSFDKKRTRILLQLLVDDKRIGRIFLEPHLKERLNLSSSKIGFHGCQAVRHDDHIHVQL